MRKHIRVGLIALASLVACLLFGGATFGACSMITDDPTTVFYGFLAIFFGVICGVSGHFAMAAAVDFKNTPGDEP